MRSSKDRTIEKKRRNKAMKVQKTEASRRKRLANKHKREAIHAIDPRLKVKIIDQKTYVNNREVEIVDNEIKLTELEKDKAYDAVPIMEADGPRYIERDSVGKIVEPVIIADFDDAVVEYQEITDGGRAIDDQIEKERIGVFDRLADRFKKKKTNL